MKKVVPQANSPIASLRGDAMLEALISMLIVLIAGLGSSYALAGMLKAKATLNAQYSAVAQMRQMIQRSGPALCTGSQTITVGTTVLALTATCTPLASTVSVNGAAVDLSSTSGAASYSVTLSATSQALFGGSGTIIVGD